MEMEAARLHQDFFLSPSPHHLAELRIDPPHSAVAFSAPGAVTGGRKRRCLLPPVSPRKKMLLELHPFYSSPSPSPPASPNTVPPLLSRRGSPTSDFSFPSARPWIGGGAGGNIFAFFENTPTTPSPAGPDVSNLSFMASPGQSTTRAGVTASGGVTLVTSPKKPTARPTANGGFMFTSSPEQPITPASSTDVGGFASLSSEPSLSPREYHGGRAVESLLSPKHARTGSTNSGGLAFHPSSPTSAAFVFSASRTSAPAVRKSGGGSKRRPRRQYVIVSAPRNSRDVPVRQQAIQPTQKAVKAYALVTAEASGSSIFSGSSARPCCTFFTSPTKASKQEVRKASSEASGSTSPCGSPAGSRCTFVPSPAKHPSAEKADKKDREMEVSSVAREGSTHAQPAACTGAQVVVRVTCTCGVRKQFCFGHCH
uniref:Uncharacterized protein n=1 Tax=Avena sativa TaxID=4498 RepID=A0ACD5U6X4_AVESA